MNPDFIYENPEEIRKHWIEFVIEGFVEENISDAALLKRALDYDWYDDNEYVYDTDKERFVSANEFYHELMDGIDVSKKFEEFKQTLLAQKESVNPSQNMEVVDNAVKKEKIRSFSDQFFEGKEKRQNRILLFKEDIFVIKEKTSS